MNLNKIVSTKPKFVLATIIVIGCSLIAYLLVCTIEFREPIVQGLTQAQWVDILKNTTDETLNPLDISRIRTNQTADLTIELPLSYEALVKHGFLSGDCKIGFKINGKSTGGVKFERSSHGNCLLYLPGNYLYLRPGTNQIQVSLLITSAAAKDRWMEIDGPLKQFVVTHDSVYPIQ